MVVVPTEPSELVKVYGIPAPAARPVAEAEAESEAALPVAAIEEASDETSAETEEALPRAPLQMLLPNSRVGAWSPAAQDSTVQSWIPLRKSMELQRQEMSVAPQLNWPAFASMLVMQYCPQGARDETSGA